jgi:hypothetical protein
MAFSKVEETAIKVPNLNRLTSDHFVLCGSKLSGELFFGNGDALESLVSVLRRLAAMA